MGVLASQGSLQVNSTNVRKMHRVGDSQVFADADIVPAVGPTLHGWLTLNL